jgi:hypothetical protein
MSHLPAEKEDPFELRKKKAVRRLVVAPPEHGVGDRVSWMCSESLSKALSKTDI